LGDRRAGAIDYFLVGAGGGVLVGMGVLPVVVAGGAADAGGFALAVGGAVVVGVVDDCVGGFLVVGVVVPPLGLGGVTPNFSLPGRQNLTDPLSEIDMQVL
jgi:hypothetical protein